MQQSFSFDVDLIIVVTYIFGKGEEASNSQHCA
jgi:hypothetical protein